MNLIISINLLICIIFVVACMLRVKKRSNSFNLYLLYDVLMSIILLAFLLNNLKIKDTWFLNLVSLVYFVACIALPPIIYLYVKSLSIDFRGKANRIEAFSHFTPAIILFIINIFCFIYFSVTPSGHIAYSYVENIMMYVNVVAMYFIFLIQVCFYSYFSIKEYYLYRKKIQDLYSFEEGIDLKWIKIFIMGFILFIFFIYLIQSIQSIDKLFFGYLITLYLIITHYSAFQQELMYKKIGLSFLFSDIKIHEHNKGAKDAANEIEETLLEENPAETETDEEAKTNFKPDLDEEITDQLSQRIKAVMENDKLYLDPDFTLTKLADALSTNTKYVSNAINTKFGKNFSSFVNEYRIIESIRLLSSEKIETHTLESIAHSSGFKSRSVFITSFKKLTGKTPSQFKKDA